MPDKTVYICERRGKDSYRVGRMDPVEPGRMLAPIFLGQGQGDLARKIARELNEAYKAGQSELAASFRESHGDCDVTQTNHTMVRFTLLHSYGLAPNDADEALCIAQLAGTWSVKPHQQVTESPFYVTFDGLLYTIHDGVPEV